MLITWLITAMAAPCPDLGVEVDAGWAAYRDAELDVAKRHIATAVGSFACQDGPVPTEQLLRLYRLDALVSITQSDRKGAVYATIRVVTIDPEAAPSDELGPELAEMHETWSARLAENVIRVAYKGNGGAWVDGRPVERRWIEVYAGEHLFQYDGPDGWVSRMDEVDTSLTLGPPGAAPPPDPAPVTSAPEPTPGRRTRRAVMLTSGAGLAAIGGGLVVGGVVAEGRFADDPYLDDSYLGCDRAELCWEAARGERIRKDAGAIRALYAAGYGALGVGVLLIGAELVVLPDPVGSGGSVRFSGRF